MQAYFYSLVSVFIVSLVSFIGIFTLAIKESKINSVLIYFVSFSVGSMLGDVFIHLLPETVETNGFTIYISMYILLGILFTFLVEKTIHWTHHIKHGGKEHETHPPITLMTLFGDGIHNFIDGLIIGASYLVSIPAGIATTIAVILHEIPQEIGNYGVLLHGGYSKKRALFFNFVSALTAVVGTALALTIGTQVAQSTVFLSAFAAGNFIYIAGSDLIPELNKHIAPRKSAFQFGTMILGVALMYALLLLE